MKFYRALQADIKKESSNSKTWMCFGNMFIKCPKQKALSIVEKGNKSIIQILLGIQFIFGDNEDRVVQPKVI